MVTKWPSGKGEIHIAVNFSSPFLEVAALDWCQDARMALVMSDLSWPVIPPTILSRGGAVAVGA